MGKLWKACHQPNLFNELHKTVHEKKLGLRSHSRYKRSPPECPAMSPHERVKLTNYVERMLCLVRFFWTKLYYTESHYRSFCRHGGPSLRVCRPFFCMRVCGGRPRVGVAQPQCLILLPFLTLEYSRNSKTHNVM